MTWLERSALGEVMRESGLWFYPIVNLLHIAGIATLFGSILLLDLRLLGVWRRLPLAGLSTPASRLAQVGVVVASTTGLGLLATKATEYVGNPFLMLKLPAIAVGIVNVSLLYRTEAWRAHRHRPLTPAEERRLAVMGGISLASWVTALAAGRLIAYW